MKNNWKKQLHQNFVAQCKKADSGKDWWNNLSAAQKAERNYDLAVNDGACGYNPHRQGDTPTYRSNNPYVVMRSIALEGKKDIKADVSPFVRHPKINSGNPIRQSEVAGRLAEAQEKLDKVTSDYAKQIWQTEIDALNNMQPA